LEELEFELLIAMSLTWKSWLILRSRRNLTMKGKQGPQFDN
jgi:hypothetical protein